MPVAVAAAALSSAVAAAAAVAADRLWQRRQGGRGQEGPKPNGGRGGSGAGRPATAGEGGVSPAKARRAVSEGTSLSRGVGDHYLSSSAGVQGADMSKVTPMMFRKNNAHNSARWHSLKIVFVLVGLPARGKSFISQRMQTFLSWLGVDTNVFNVGQHRRHNETEVQDAQYFSAQNDASKNSRDALAFEVLDLLLAWLDSRPQAAAIFDATNSTVERRRHVRDHIAKHNPTYVVIFVESYCDDPEVLEANVRMKLAKSPDYTGVPYEEARKDFLARIENYERVYETLDDTGEKEQELSYIKLVNLSSHLVAHRVYGLAATSLLPYLTALHISPRPVWLVRMGQADESGLADVEPGSPTKHSFSELPMSTAGEAFAANLAAHVGSWQEMPAARLLVCSHRRALDMAAMLDPEGLRTSVRAFLNPMDWGSVDGIRRKDFKERTDPKFFEAFSEDPVNTRFPGGESYADFVRRLMTVLVEVEQQVEPVLVIAPVTTLQVLHCYFGKQLVHEASDVFIPQHSVVQWVPDGGNFSRSVLSEEDLAKKGAEAGPPSPEQRKKRVGRAVGSIMFGKGQSPLGVTRP